MGGACSTLARDRNAYKILIGEPDTTQKPGRRWEDNIGIYVPECGKVWTGCIWFRIGITGGLL